MQKFLTTHPRLDGWLYIAKIDACIILPFYAGALLATHLRFYWQ